MEPRLIVAFGLVVVTVILAAGMFAYRSYQVHQRRRERRLRHETALAARDDFERGVLARSSEQ